MNGTLTFTEASPAQSFSEVLTYAEVAGFLNLPVRNPPDVEEDALVTSFIQAAREQAEIMQARDLIQKQYDLNFDYWPGHEIELRTPLVSVDLVRYRDSDGDYVTLVENTDYVVDLAKGVIVPVYGEQWPSFTAWPSSAVLIRHTSGFASTATFWQDAGARVKIGMKLLISQWFHNRIPFEKGASAIVEYPYAVTACLGFGAVPRAR